MRPRFNRAYRARRMVSLALAVVAVVVGADGPAEGTGHVRDGLPLGFAGQINHR